MKCSSEHCNDDGCCPTIYSPRFNQHPKEGPMSNEAEQTHLRLHNESANQVLEDAHALEAEAEFLRIKATSLDSRAKALRDRAQRHTK